MPAGAHWTLRYEPTIDDRIQSRVDIQRLRQDEFVLSVERVGHGYRDPIIVEVQFGEDRDGPYDSRITSEIGDCRRVIIPEPEPERPRRSFRELLEDFIATPVSRSRLAQAMAAPLRARLDYTSSARRTLITELPGIEHTYSEVTPLDQGQFGDSVQQGIARLAGFANQLGMQGSQGRQGNQYSGFGLQGVQGAIGFQGPIGFQGTPGGQGQEPLREKDIPKWLKPGVWAKSGDNYIEVISIETELVLWGPAVKFKFWRRIEPTQSLQLNAFLQSYTQCEKPTEPTSRYERIIKGI